MQNYLHGARPVRPRHAAEGSDAIKPLEVCRAPAPLLRQALLGCVNSATFEGVVPSSIFHRGDVGSIMGREVREKLEFLAGMPEFAIPKDPTKGLLFNSVEENLLSQDSRSIVILDEGEVSAEHNGKEVRKVSANFEKIRERRCNK